MKKNDNKLLKKIEDALDIGGEGTASIIGSIMADSLIGQFLPGVTTAAFSYKLKRQERNILKFIHLCHEKHKEFDERLERLEKESLKQFTGCFELVVDYVYDEPQEKKIDYMVNGLLGLSEHTDIKEDFVLHYYDVLKNLRIVDIDVLIYYYHGTLQSTDDVIDKHNLSFDQYNSVRLKLERNGLLKTRFDDQLEDLYENMINLQTFIEQTVKGKGVKLKRLNKLNKRDSFSISRFGRDFIEFFVRGNVVEEAELIDHFIKENQY